MGEVGEEEEEGCCFRRGATGESSRCEMELDGRKDGLCGGS